jgi:DNA-binding NarL/FixJ family response regulator
MSTSLRLAGDMLSATRSTHDETTEPFRILTAAERAVARLAVDGLSYKEIARRLDRSVSTVDHQLRSARSKLGVRSTARLVNLMSGLRSH